MIKKLTLSSILLFFILSASITYADSTAPVPIEIQKTINTFRELFNQILKEKTKIYRTGTFPDAAQR